MKIELTKIRIADLFKGYEDSQEEGVVAYGGRLDVRPKYQREFVYRDEQRNAVIHTVLKGFPLNVMYWAKKDDGNFEVLDGQQRTISICQYLNHDFSVQDEGMTMYIDTWPEDKRQKILDYELMIYICEGGDAEKTYNKINADIIFDIRFKVDRIRFSVKIQDYQVIQVFDGTVVENRKVYVKDCYPVNMDSDHKKSYSQAFINSNSKCLNYAHHFLNYLNRNIQTTEKKITEDW